MKIKFGALVVDGRGKVGGHVMSKNRGGAYMRTKVTPINPQTAFQSAVRATLTAFAQGWRALTANQRAAWNSAVSNFTKTDVFGDIKKPSGINLYVKLNSNITTGEGTPITEPPALTSSPELVTITVTSDASTPTLSAAFGASPVPADTSYVIEATAQQSPGKSFLKNQYRVLMVVPAAGTTPSNILSAYTSRFGTLVAGQKIGFRIYAIDLLTGIKGQASTEEIIVQP